MPSTRLLLVRHGETDDNVNLVFQGQTGLGLNAHGRDQAARLAARLVRAGRRPAALYTSDLDRAAQTAEILGRALGLAPRPDPDLREVFLGAWQGLTGAEVAARFPEEWAAFRRGEDLKRGGGESYAELGERVARALDRVAAAHPGEAVLVVSHGASIKSFVARMMGLGAQGMRAFRVNDNTGVTVIARDAQGNDRLAVWNDASHLGDAVLDHLAER